MQADLSPFVWLWCASATLLAWGARTLVTRANEPAEQPKPAAVPLPAAAVPLPPAITDPIPQAAD